MEVNAYKTRPILLTIFCILSFIGTFASAFSYLFTYIYYDLIPTIVVPEMFGELYGDVFELLFNVGKKYYLYAGLLNIGAFIGVCFLWKMRKIGLHIYAIAQLLILIVSTIYLYRPMNISPVSDLLLSLVFILVYFRFRKEMD
ncbi:MAG: hypothetical protein LBM67_09235 [Lentimicrobiaceae bacterium]|nr:hypothetical protein [Lentimicrobiaceae bacterium]